MLNISFDFDESTHKVANLKVTELETVCKSETFQGNDLEVLSGKIQLSDNAVNKLNAHVGDRISINYWYSGPNDAYPIVSKSEIFTDGVDGLKLTKSKSLTFRGEQRETLLKYGTIFSFEEWKDKTGKVKEGVFKLIPVTKDDSESVEKELAFEEVKVEATEQKELEDDADWLLEL